MVGAALGSLLDDTACVQHDEAVTPALGQGEHVGTITPARTDAWRPRKWRSKMAAVHDRRGSVVSENLGDERLGTLKQSTPRTGRKWVAPTWQRLETPMEVTMYVGRR